jgi:hypothetical protein
MPSKGKEANTPAAAGGGGGGHRSVIAVGYDDDDHRRGRDHHGDMEIYKGQTFDTNGEDDDRLKRSKKRKQELGELHPGRENAFFVLRLIKWVHDLVADICEDHPTAVKAFFTIIFVVVYHTYLGDSDSDVLCQQNKSFNFILPAFAISKNFDRSANLFGGTMFFWILIIYFQLVKPYGIKSDTWRGFTAPIRQKIHRMCDKPWAAK